MTATADMPISQKQRHWLALMQNQCKLVLSPNHPEPWFMEFLEIYRQETMEMIGEIQRALDTDDSRRASELLGHYFAKEGPDNGVRRAIILYAKSKEI